MIASGRSLRACRPVIMTYLPSAFRQEDEARIAALLAAFPLATLITRTAVVAALTGLNTANARAMAELVADGSEPR